METAEYNCLMTETANFMTEQDCAMFHGVAFLYGKDAYILTASSGTGKTTQFRNLRDMYGDRFRIINGDKPLLGPGPNGQIMVYPSPWNGKEQWGSTEHGPLRGLFLLEQGQENRLEVMDGGEARGKLTYLREINETGAYYWHMAEAGKGTSEMLAAAVEVYDASPKILEKGLRLFLRELMEKGYLLEEI